MIITISQTASNIKQSYTIEGDNFYFKGDNGKFNSFQKIILSNKNDTIMGVFNLSKWINYIPFRYLFGGTNLSRLFLLYKNDSLYGSIVFSKHGFYKSFYVIALDDGQILHCYNLSKGSFDYVSIYNGGKQIALIETYLNVNDYKYTHKLYILDEHDNLSDTLSFFTLYYANYHFAKRFHMSKGSVYQKSWSYSKYNNKYNETWRETHFPNENFFGKINLFD